MSGVPDLPEREIDVMLHALGVSQTPRRRDMGWRNYFLAGAKHIEPWESLVSKGLAVRNSRDANCYHVSPTGLKLLRVAEKF